MDLSQQFYDITIPWLADAENDEHNPQFYGNMADSVVDSSDNEIDDDSQALGSFYVAEGNGGNPTYTATAQSTGLTQFGNHQMISTM